MTGSASRPAYVRGRQAAQALRLRERLGFGPLDIWRTLDAVGVPVALHEFGQGGGEGLYLWEHGQPLIVINASNRPSRQRFTAAHELGHHEMHRFEHDGLLLADSNMFASTEPWEVEANAFAAYLLAPDEAIREHLARTGGPAPVTADTVVELMGVFGLSYTALTYRLLNAGVISRSEQQQLQHTPMVQERMRRAGVDEDTGQPSPARLPRTHVNDALRLYEQHVVSPARLAELLDLTETEALSFAAARGVEPAAQLPVDEDAVDALLRGT